MIRELKRIEPKSVVRIAFFIGLLCGFLFGIYSSFVLNELSTMLSAKDAAVLGGLSGSSALLTGVIMALTGSLFFSLMGWLLTVVYNFIAHRFGGIEYTVIEHGQSGTHPHLTSHRDDDDEA